ncbi:VOC family protein [uncultured Croceitalea sp.]|uniref:VOC family protein n=1 Tax=uncultured Croceitalea sp. TaxID=1798908 RepID=UPI003305BFDC
MRFAHTNIVSLDWKKLADFYIKTFGCQLVPPVRKQSGPWLEKGTGLRNASLTGAHLLLPGHGEHGPTLEIYQYTGVQTQKALPPNHQGLRHLAFEVDDVAATLTILKANGGKACGEITTRTVNGVGDITFVYASDPEDNLIELQSWR